MMTTVSPGVLASIERLISIFENGGKEFSVDEVNSLFDFVVAHHTQAGAIMLLISRSMMKGSKEATDRAIEIFTEVKA